MIRNATRWLMRWMCCRACRFRFRIGRGMCCQRVPMGSEALIWSEWSGMVSLRGCSVRANRKAARSVTLVRAGDARAYLPSTTVEKMLTGAEGVTAEAGRVYEFIVGEGVVDSETLLAGLPGMTPSELATAIRDLALTGLITGDSWRAAMAISSSTAVRTASQSPQTSSRNRSRHYRSRSGARRQFAHRLREAQNVLAPGVNWSATSRFSFLGPELGEAHLADKRAEALLRRHGIVTRRALEIDQLGWDWQPIYNALNLMELRGVVRRGYFVNGLPGVQFASVEFVDTMRAAGRREGDTVPLVVTATDPAYVFDRRLASVSNEVESGLLDFSRNSSTRVVFAGGVPVMVAYSNGARIVTGDESDAVIEEGIRALVGTIAQTSSTRRVVIGEWNGEPVIASSAAEMLARIGFRRDYPNMVIDALNLPKTVIGRRD